MLTLGEVHNMGLNRGFRPGGDHNLFVRDSFAVDCVSASLEAASGNVLQQQLNDFIHNSYLQQGAEQHCVPLHADASCLMGSGSYAGLTSMGFAQTDIDRSLLYEDLSPVTDHDVRVPTSVINVPTVPFTPISGLGLDTTPAGLSSALLHPQRSRVRWGDATLLSARGIKRADEDLHQTNMQPRKKFDNNPRNVDAKWKRPTEQAEHILRERQRRDDMTSKFAVLESLLPPGSKRDRSTIVDDSIVYVKNLHHRIKSLQQRKVELIQAAVATSIENTAFGCRKGPIEVLQPSHGSPRQAKDKVLGVKKPTLSMEELRKNHSALRCCLEKMEVHADLPHQVVIEMVCRPQSRLQSDILKSLESLNLDVVQCSITKAVHRLICIISAKPQEVDTETSGIVAALKYALGSDQQLPGSAEDPMG